MKEIHKMLKAIFRDSVKILKHVHTVMYKLCSEVKMILNQISKQNHLCFAHISILSLWSNLAYTLPTESNWSNDV